MQLGVFSRPATSGHPEAEAFYEALGFEELYGRGGAGLADPPEWKLRDWLVSEYSRKTRSANRIWDSEGAGALLADYFEPARPTEARTSSARAQQSAQRIQNSNRPDYLCQRNPDGNLLVLPLKIASAKASPAAAAGVMQVCLSKATLKAELAAASRVMKHYA